MKRVVAGTLLMLAALALQFAMVVRVVERDVLLSVLGYGALLAGMAVVVVGILAWHR